MFDLTKMLKLIQHTVAITLLLLEYWKYRK